MHTTKITVIQHNISHVTTFHKQLQIDYNPSESLLLQTKSCKVAEANSLTHTPEFKYKYQHADHIPQKHLDKINRDHAHDLVFITRRVETILTEALIKKVICNKRE